MIPEKGPQQNSEQSPKGGHSTVHPKKDKKWHTEVAKKWHTGKWTKSGAPVIVQKMDILHCVVDKGNRQRVDILQREVDKQWTFYAGKCSKTNTFRA